MTRGPDEPPRWSRPWRGWSSCTSSGKTWLVISFSGRSGCMIAGSMVALVTPMDAQGRLDWDSLSKLVGFHLQEGTNAIVATVPLTWPPASQPCATITSTPELTACRASAAEPTVCKTIAPPAFARGTREEGSRQKNETTGTRSSRQTARRSSCGNSKFRFTPNGREVRARVWRIYCRTASRSARQGTSIPRAPALLTAAARLGPTAPPIGA